MSNPALRLEPSPSSNSAHFPPEAPVDDGTSCSCGCSRSRATCRAERAQWLVHSLNGHEDRAVEFLDRRHRRGVLRALRRGILEPLGRSEVERTWRLKRRHDEGFQGGLDWLLAEGKLQRPTGRRLVADVLLARGGPQLDPRFRGWLEAQKGQAMSLCEVGPIFPAVGAWLRNLMEEAAQPFFVYDSEIETLVRTGQALGLRTVHWLGDWFVSGFTIRLLDEDVEELCRDRPRDLSRAMAEHWLRGGLMEIGTESDLEWDE